MPQLSLFDCEKRVEREKRKVGRPSAYFRPTGYAVDALAEAQARTFVERECPAGRVGRKDRFAFHRSFKPRTSANFTPLRWRSFRVERQAQYPSRHHGAASTSLREGTRSRHYARQWLLP